MITLERLLSAYLLWLCRILGVGLDQINAARDDDTEDRAPRPERARIYRF
jgi:hypothetical protein